MPTAISRLYTPSGFVVAADGLVRNGTTGAVTKDNMQKVFHFGNAPLAYSFTGAALLGRADSDDADEVLFDFIAELSTSVEAVSVRRAPTLQDYAARFTKPVYRALEAAMQRGNISLPEIPSADPDERGYAIVIINVDGYHHGEPSRVRIRFPHEDQKLLPPEITIEDLAPGRPVVYGIREIGNRILSQDPSLSHYMLAVELDDSYNSDLANGIAFSRAFIAACAGPEGAAINPKGSASIGGHTCIATVTPVNGFRWVPGYEPAAH